MSRSLLLVLPRRAALAGGPRMPALERLLARGAMLAPEADAEHPWLGRVFALPKRPWPWAALSRDSDAGDAGDDAWLRADPAHVRADIAGARLLAVGDIGLGLEEAEALRSALAPLFGDFGLELSAPHPERWYLRLPRGSGLPAFSPPWAALGDDPRAHPPQGAEAARWRRAMNECQVLLHAHPVNARRAAAGRATVNSLWFWGAGVRPARVAAQVDAIAGDDPLLVALARAAGVPVSRSTPPEGSRTLLDLRALRDPAALDAQWLTPAWRALRAGRIAALRVLFADGASCASTRWMAFAAWRRPRPLPP